MLFDLRAVPQAFDSSCPEIPALFLKEHLIRFFLSSFRFDNLNVDEGTKHVQDEELGMEF